mgnify:FL=1
MNNFSLKDINLINRCFSEIEEFNLSRSSQFKLILFINTKLKENKNLKNEINRLRNILKKNGILN